MYQDVTFYAQRVLRDFEDLKIKLKENTPPAKVHGILKDIGKKLIFFIRYNIKYAREYRREFEQMCVLIENHRQVGGMIDELEERMIRLRNRAINADKQEEKVKEFVLR